MKEAMRNGEPRCEVGAQYKRFHESLRKMSYAGLTRPACSSCFRSVLPARANFLVFDIFDVSLEIFERGSDDSLPRAL
jgi:hypothetical protein